MLLPDPDQYPGSDVVIYDGQCQFCRGQVERLMRWDGKNRLTYISLHDKRVSERYPDLSYDQLMEQMYVVTPTGERHGGASAVRYLSRRLPRLFLLAPLLHIPGTLPLWRWGYRWVAKRRYRIAGKNCDGDTCSIHLK